MLGLSLVFLLAAASLHAVSNALIKQARDKLAFTWWMLTANLILGVPLIFFMNNVPPIGWELIGLSGLIEAVYFITLTRAYALGDLSQVYPIARFGADVCTAVGGSVPGRSAERRWPDRGFVDCRRIVSGESTFAGRLATSAVRTEIGSSTLGIDDRLADLDLFADR